MGFAKNFSTIINNYYIMVVHWSADYWPMPISKRPIPIIGHWTNYRPIQIIGAPLVLRHFKVIILLLKQQYISSLRVHGVCLSSSGHGYILGHLWPMALCAVLSFFNSWKKFQYVNFNILKVNVEIIDKTCTFKLQWRVVYFFDWDGV